MKKLILTSVIALLLSSGSIASAQNYPKEYLGLPGDNLNLYAVMDLFRESETIEGFERKLNDPELVINNLDLNGDNYVDYIFVTDYIDGNVHNIVLSVAVNEKDFQDLAVFIVEKQRDGSVIIQLIGDEALYGKNYIIEPNYGETPNPGYKGATAGSNNGKVVTTTYYHVATWPVVRYMYTPTYVVWHSPYYYDYYPVYWVHWRPYYWHYYYGYHYNYYGHYYSYYRTYPHYRYPRYHDFYYTGKRRYSTQVGLRIREGYYRTTYSRPDERSRGENHYHKAASTRSPGNNSATGNNSPYYGSRNSNNSNNAGAGSKAGYDNRVSTPRAKSTPNSTDNSKNFRSGNTATDIRKSTTNDNNRPQNPTPAVRPDNNTGTRSENKAPEVKSNNYTRSSNSSEKVKGNTSARPSNSSSEVKSSTSTRPSNSSSKVKSNTSTRPSNSSSEVKRNNNNRASAGSKGTTSRGSVSKTSSRSSNSSATQRSSSAGETSRRGSNGRR